METRRAVSYIRVSTKEQAMRHGDPEGYSLPTQRQEIAQKAESLGAVLVDEYLDKDTGTSVHKRPAMQALLDRIKTERDVDYVIVFKLDRWARMAREDHNADFILECAGTALVSCSETIDRTAAGRLVHGLVASVTEYQSRNQGDDIKRKTLAKVKGGGTAGRAPLGYLNKQDGIDVRYVVLDPERADLVRWAFEAYATGDWTTRQLLGELTRKGLRSRPTPSSPAKVLRVGSLHAMLTNPYYKGIVRFKGVEYDGRHEPLVSVETWQRVQDALASKVSGEKQRSHHHYLKGTLFCGHCGNRLIVTHSVNRQGNIYPYFVCLGRHQRYSDCRLKAQRIDVVEALVVQHYQHVRLGTRLLKLTKDALLEELRSEQALGEC